MIEFDAFVGVQLLLSLAFWYLRPFSADSCCVTNCRSRASVLAPRGSSCHSSLSRGVLETSVQMLSSNSISVLRVAVFELRSMSGGRACSTCIVDRSKQCFRAALRHCLSTPCIGGSRLHHALMVVTLKCMRRQCTTYQAEGHDGKKEGCASDVRGLSAVIDAWIICADRLQISLRPCSTTFWKNT